MNSEIEKDNGYTITYPDGQDPAVPNFAIETTPDPDYTIIDTDGTKIDPTQPQTAPTAHQTMENAQKRLHALQQIREMIRRGKRARMLAEHKRKQKPKNRAKAKRAAASRKRNR